MRFQSVGAALCITKTNQAGFPRHGAKPYSNQGTELHLTICQAPEMNKSTGCLAHFQSAAREVDEIAKPRTGTDPHLIPIDQA